MTLGGPDHSNVKWPIMSRPPQRWKEDIQLNVICQMRQAIMLDSIPQEDLL